MKWKINEPDYASVYDNLTPETPDATYVQRYLF